MIMKVGRGERWGIVGGGILGMTLAHLVGAAIARRRRGVATVA